jgi:glycosidase
MTAIESTAPRTLAECDLRPRGAVHPSPLDWRDQVIYFLLPDRFSDGRESTRPRFDRTQPAQYHTPDKRTWMDSGKRFQGGTLKGIQSKLSYLRDLGVSTLWVGPVWKQRRELETYHGYGIQNFLDVDPRFGTAQDLRDLVDDAHRLGMYVLLDIIYNHTGNNWFYDDRGMPRDTMPYRYEPAYPFHSWRSGSGQPTQTIVDVDDGVWPREFQNRDWYTRAGHIERWDPEGWEDPRNPKVQFRRGDFFDLKDLNHERDDVLNAVIRAYQYWIAVSDCDGYRIDTVKHISYSASQRFCGAIREYCEVIGKFNFLLLGEVTGGEYMAKSYIEVWGRNLDAILDIGEARQNLIGMCKGLGSPQAFFDQYQPHDVLGEHRETGRYHVSILDDHDMVGGKKARFAAGDYVTSEPEQVAHAVGVQLTTLGTPCIYYGTEQGFDGTQDQHDLTIEPFLSFEDRYIRESMFGSPFGAFETSGCHFFDPDHPTYLRIAAIARVRSRRDAIGLALRRGRQYLRPITKTGTYFVLPDAGDLVAWSRLLFQTEVVVILNSHGAAQRSAYVLVDYVLSPPTSALSVLYRSDWSDAQLKSPPRDEKLVVEHVNGSAAVKVDLPPAGMMILAAV